MQSINFNKGYKTYAINGDENNTISINIGDLNLMTRLLDTQKEVEKLTEKYKDEEQLTPERLTAIDTEIKAKLDYAFGTDISSHVFGPLNCMSIVSGGKLLLESFLEAFLPILENDVEEYKKNAEEFKAANHFKLDEGKTQKYITPVIPLANPSPAVEKVDISKLSQAEKDRILSEIFK